MISYLSLLVIIVVVAVVAYIVLDKDILSPTLISAFMFGVGVIFAFIGVFSWNRISSLNIQSILAIVLGLISFFCGELVARKFKIKKKYNISDKIFEKYEEKNKVYKVILVLGLIFVLVTTVLLFMEISKICEYYEYSGNNISEMLAFYRTKTELFSTSMADNNIGINFFVKQMKKVCEVINIIFAYLLIKNIVYKNIKKNIVENLLLSVTIIIALLQTFLNSGGRSILMHYLVAYIALYLMLYFRKNQGKKFDFKMLTKICIVGIALLILFYALAPLVGRSATENFTDYITFYLGAPIPSLSVFMENGVRNEEFGSETFSSVYYVLNKLHIIDYNKAQTYEWLSFKNGLASNVYTSFRAYCFDFGFIGIIVLQFLFGFVYTKFYLIAKNSNKNFYRILYAYYFYILIDQIRAEQFYALLNTATIAMLLIFIVLYRVILCSKNKKGIVYEIKENNA